MTTITSENDYVARGQAIAATISGIGTDVTSGADLATPPGYEVFMKSGTHQRESGSRKRVVTTTLSFRFYHTLTDATKESSLRTARTAAQGASMGYVDALFAAVNLNGLATTGDAQVSYGLMPYGTNVYYGFDIDLTIFYNRG